MLDEPMLDEPLFGQRVLVTGGAGFIGKRLTARLAEIGAEVLVLDRAPDTATSDDLARDDLVRALGHVQVDLRDGQAVADCLISFRPQIVFHLACAPDAAENDQQLRKSIDDNLTLTLNVLEAFRRSGPGLFILADSSKVYGNSSVPHRSELAPDPLSSYAIGKCASWHYCRYFERLCGMRVVSVRPTLIYGPNQAFNVVSYAVQRVLNSEPLIRLAGGYQTRDPLFIDDALEAYLAAARYGSQLSGRVINIGGGHEITVLDLVQKIVRLMSGTAHVEPDPTQMRETEILRSYCDNAEAWEWLGWRPTTDLDTGLRKTIEALVTELVG